MMWVNSGIVRFQLYQTVANQTLNRTACHFRSKPAKKVQFPLVVLIALPTPYASLRRDKQKSYFFATPLFQLPTDDVRVHNAAAAMRPFTSMLAPKNYV